MDALDWLVQDLARDEVVRLMPRFNIAAEKALARTDQALGDLAGVLRRQAFADFFRTFLASELQAMDKQPEVSVESGNRNGITLQVTRSRDVKIHVLKAQRKDGSPKAGRQSTERQAACSFTAALFDLHEMGFEVRGPVTLMLTWRVDVAGVHLYITLPKDPQHLTRYEQSAQWSAPLDFPIITVSAGIADLLNDDDDDLGYGRRMPNTAESGEDNDGNDAA